MPRVGGFAVCLASFLLFRAAWAAFRGSSSIVSRETNIRARIDATRVQKQDIFHSRGSGFAGCMVLRGGEEVNIATIDARLHDEILQDCKRWKEGKLPMFIENIGKEPESFGSTRYADGIEAMMPPAITGGDDDEMGGDQVGSPSAVGGEGLTEQQKVEDTRTRESREMEEAKEWFAALDRRYFTEDDGGERFRGHRGIWQRRELTADADLESYFEMREEAHELDRFVKSIPAHLKPNSPELKQWLDDYGWNDIILRNGTRMKWEPDMVFDDEEEEEDDGEYRWDPPLGRDLQWFNATLRDLVGQAWKGGMDAHEAAVFFRGHNATMYNLAVMHTMLSDSQMLDVREELEEEAHRADAEEAGMEPAGGGETADGGDAEHGRRFAVVAECFAFLLVKWREFFHGPVYREDIVAALDKAEASFRGRHGDKAAQYFNVPRPRDYYADPADD